MTALELKAIDSSRKDMTTIRIGGFQDGELSDLKRLEHNDARDKLLNMLDERNHEIGTKWWRSCEVVSWWFDNEFAYVNFRETLVRTDDGGKQC